MKLLRPFLMLAALAAAGMPSRLFACAACFGRTDSPLAVGMNWGILTLLGVVLTVLSGILVFFVHIIRKEEAQSQPQPPPANPTPDV